MDDGGTLMDWKHPFWKISGVKISTAGDLEIAPPPESFGAAHHKLHAIRAHII